MRTKLTAHPALGILAIEGRGIGEIAREADYNPQYVSRVLKRQLPLTAEFRRRMVEVLGRPDHELFDSADEAVAL